MLVVAAACVNGIRGGDDLHGDCAGREETRFSNRVRISIQQRADFDSTKTDCESPLAHWCYMRATRAMVFDSVSSGTVCAVSPCVVRFLPLVLVAVGPALALLTPPQLAGDEDQYTVHLIFSNHLVGRPPPPRPLTSWTIASPCLPHSAGACFWPACTRPLPPASP